MKVAILYKEAFFSGIKALHLQGKAHASAGTDL